MSGTPAGRLLHKLYGASKPQIQYPKLHTRRRDPSEKRAAFCPAGGKVGVDARGGGKWRDVVVKDPTRTMTRNRSRQTDLSLREVPTFGFVDYHRGKIRSKKKIGRDADRLEEYVTAYRPPNRSDHSSDASKRRLQTRFHIMGGKALPSAGMLPSNLGSDVEAQAASRVETLTTANAALIDYAEAKAMQAHRDRGKSSEAEKLFDEVMKELEERRAHLKELHALGDHSHDDRITNEIAVRVRDLDELDSIIKKQQMKRESVFRT